MKPGKRFFLVLAPVLIAALLFGGAWSWLSFYTRHNDKVNVPDLKTLGVADATQRLEALGLHAEVIDSVYTDAVPKSSVVDQDPHAGKDVKPDRTIYLVMNASQPKMLNMPALVNLSKRQAMSVLEIIGLKVAELQYRPDPCLDCVVAQLYKGQPIAPEQRIRRGEALTLVLGSRQNGSRVPVPDVRNQAQQDCIVTLVTNNLKPRTATQTFDPTVPAGDCIGTNPSTGGGGCGCRIDAPASSTGGVGALFAFAAVALVASRRRRRR